MTLALFFTRGISLDDWIELGIIDREKIIYEEHLLQDTFNKILWFTYGSKDNDHAEKLKENNRLHKRIEVIAMPVIFNLPFIGSFLYSILMPLIHRNLIIRCDVLKTNQMDGSWSAVISKILYKKKLILRTGYTLSQLENKLNPHRIIKNTFIEIIERISYKLCNISTVTSQHNKNYLSNKYNIPSNKIIVIHNYVDTNLFKPMMLTRYEDRILFIGRLTKVKNLHHLIDAIKDTRLTLDIYGQGELETVLFQHARKSNIKVNLLGVVSNNELACILNKYKYYILPSLYEGMPKTLLEAMACGCVCIGTNVKGINEVIIDGVNGYLSNELTSDSLLETINKAIKSINTNIISNGLCTINEHYSLHSVVYRERELFKSLYI